MTQPSFALCIPGLSCATWLFPVFRKRQVVGRSPDAGIRIGDRSVSRKHAEVWSSGSRVLIRDMKSRNGTYLRKTRVSEVELQPGDEIRIGRVFHLLVTDSTGQPDANTCSDSAASSIKQFVDSLSEPAFDRQQIASMYSLTRSLYDCSDAFQSLVAVNEWMSDWLGAHLAVVTSPGEQRTTFSDRLSGHGTTVADYDMETVDECVGNGSLVFRKNVAQYDQRKDTTIRRDIVAMPLKCGDGFKVVYGEIPHSPDTQQLKLQLDLAFRIIQKRIQELNGAESQPFNRFDPSRSLPTQPDHRLTQTMHQILQILCHRGERMTKDQIITELEAKNGAASDGSTKQMLAEMVRHEILTNRQDTKPRGYGLPDWP